MNNIRSCVSIFILIVVCCSACASEHAASGKLIQLEGCMDLEVKEEWIKKSFKRASGQLGLPTEKETFLMRDAAITEFRGKLDVLFPRSEEKNHSIEVMEATWNQGSACNLTIWFQRSESSWISVDALLWDKDTEF